MEQNRSICLNEATYLIAKDRLCSLLQYGSPLLYVAEALGLRAHAWTLTHFRSSWLLCACRASLSLA